MQGHAAHPVVVPVEGVQQLAGLTQEELDQLVPAPREDELLEVVGNAVRALLAQLLQRVHPHLRRELVLQELRVHQLRTRVSFYQQHRLNHLLVGEEAKGWRLPVDIPDNDALIVRPAHKRLPVLGNAQPPDPAIVASEGLLAVCGAAIMK